MRALLLMRHAKSDWNAGSGLDRDRPLGRRGVKAARRVGRFLAAAGWAPELAVTSPAQRARTTVELAAEAGGWRCEVRVSDALYDGGVEGVLGEVMQLPEGCERALIAGHEPTCSVLLTELLGGGRFRFPTGAVAAIGFGSESWAGLQEGSGELLWMLVPRLLPDT